MTRLNHHELDETGIAGRARALAGLCLLAFWICAVAGCAVAFA